jgi:hypothetical protein
LLKDVKLLELDMHDKEKALEVFDNKQNWNKVQQEKQWAETGSISDLKDKDK